MPTNDDRELGVRNSANDPTVVLASVDDDGNANFELGRAVLEAGPTETTIPYQPFVGMMGRGSNGLGNTTAPMPGVVGFGGFPTSADDALQGACGVVGVGGKATPLFDTGFMAGAGVWGIGGEGYPGRDGAGVVGVSGRIVNPKFPFPGLETEMPSPSLTKNVGVFGSSESGRGVMGVSNGNEEDAGVFGTSTEGTGVQAESVTGAGVVGTSVENRGAIFSSGEAGRRAIAQLRLVPLPPGSTDKLPENGLPGDLFVRQVIGPNQEPEVEMWLCLRPAMDNLTAMWGRFAFSDIHTA